MRIIAQSYFHDTKQVAWPSVAVNYFGAVRGKNKERGSVFLSEPLLNRGRHAEIWTLDFYRVSVY